ncbi:uncharacterized protein MKK02DRAFT_45556 [Dioszegia hungarica]|uniref:UAS domain-containing protein n=1 Tax=Dioszegia hungarica TaxID=4972 RepID=A0AA38H9E7_9TREE|nr:uncharacterized protein MKK02DRAFT_45556 [Dioszegia hungarica]KAI9636848.1 hypothetical protein MKK02DRAFT_45556 [Dioszegia hungarica]
MSLTPAQHSALEQLSAITASTTTAARDRDERLLRENGWDVQATVEQIFASGGSLTADAQDGSSSSARTPPAAFRRDDEDQRPATSARRPSGSNVRPRRPSQPGYGGAGIPGGGGGGMSVLDLVMSPFRLALGVVSGIWYFIIRNAMPVTFLRYLPPFLRPPTTSRSTSSSNRRLQDPTTTSLTYIRDLERLTGCSATSGTLPEIYIGPYREFLNTLRKDGKVGMVLVTCAEHEDDVKFKRETLADGEMVRFLKEKEILLWAGDVRSREGYQVAGTLLATTYPSIYFMSLLPGHAGAAPKISIIATLSGSPATSTSSASIIQSLTTSVLPRTNAFLARMKRERSTLEEARHLREEQDRAFASAAQRDQAKILAQRQKETAERQEREAIAAREAAERDQKAKAEREKVDALEKRAVWRRYARKHLLSPSDGPLRIALRTPLNASRNVRQFTPGRSTEGLFIYAETLLIPDSDTPESDPDRPPAGYEPPTDFVIVTSYPRKEVPRVSQGGEEAWEMVKKAGGALFAEKAEGSTWGTVSGDGADSSDEEVVDDSD